MSSSVAVLGAGIQGSLIALALAKNNIRVDLYDRADDCMTAASLWNEGKIHLGFVYANDHTFETAKLMARAAFRFIPIIEDLCGCSISTQAISEPFLYARHRDSLLCAEDLEAHYARIEKYIITEKLATSGRYPGYQEGGIFKRLSSSDTARIYSDAISHAWATAERAINPSCLAATIQTAVRKSSMINCCFSTPVASVSSDTAQRYTIHTENHDMRGPYSAVVNTSWDSRIAIDHTLGIETNHSFSFRYKFALFGDASTAPTNIRSTTIVLGPFGDLVRYARGKCFLSWYPAGCTHSSHEIQPPRWDLTVGDDYKRIVTREIIAALEQIFPDLPDYITNKELLQINGGVIYSRGLDNITDLECEVHQRFQVGVAKYGNYYSIDTGKLTTAPLFAEQAVHMIIDSLGVWS